MSVIKSFPSAILGTQSLSSTSGKQALKDNLLEVAKENLVIIKSLLKEAEKLDKAGKKADSNRIVSIAEEILSNNKKIVELVGDITRSS